MYLHKDSQHSFMISYFGFYRRNFKKRIESLKKNISRKKLHSVVSSLLCVLRSSNSRKFISIRSRPYDCLTRSSTYKRMCDNIICRFLWSDAVWRKRAVDDVGRHENVKFRSETTPRVCSSVENVLVGVRYGYPVSLYGRRYYKCIPNTHLDCLTTRFQKRYLFIVYYLSSILSKRRLHKKSRAELEKNARPSSTRTVTYDTPVWQVKDVRQRGCFAIVTQRLSRHECEYVHRQFVLLQITTLGRNGRRYLNYDTALCLNGTSVFLYVVFE